MFFLNLLYISRNKGILTEEISKTKVIRIWVYLEKKDCTGVVSGQRVLGLKI